MVTIDVYEFGKNSLFTGVIDTRGPCRIGIILQSESNEPNKDVTLDYLEMATSTDILKTNSEFYKLNSGIVFKLTDMTLQKTKKKLKKSSVT